MRLLPVMKLLIGDSRKQIASPISLGSPNLFIGTFSRSFRTKSGLISIALATAGVLMNLTMKYERPQRNAN